MRYFVYRDSQILGPFAPEELHQAGDLRHDTLICEENHTGRSDADWRPLKEVPELSDVRVLEPAFFDEAPPGAGPGGLERLELDALGVPEDDEQGVAWIRSLFEDADFRGRFSGLLPRAEDDPQQLSLAKSRIAELTGELEALRSRLSEVENARHAHWKTVELPKILESAVSLPPPSAGTANSPPPAPPEPELPKQEPLPSPPKAGPRLRIVAPTPLSGGSTPSVEAASNPAPVRGLRLKISSGGSLPVAQPAVAPEPVPESSPAPAEAAEPAAAGPVFDWQETAKTEVAALPEAKPLPAGPIAAPEPAPSAGDSAEALLPPGVRPIEIKPPSAPTLAPAEAAASPEPAPLASLEPAGLQPAPIALEAPAPAPSLQAVPLPPLAAANPPLTAVFGPGESSAFGGAPGTVSAPIDLGGNPVDLGAAPTTGAAESPVADVVARLAKPAPTQIPAPKPPRRGVSRLVLAALFGLTAAVAGAFFLFLRNPRDLKTMVAMGSDQKPLGVEAPDEAALKPAAPATPAAPQAQPASPAVSPAPQAAQPAASPAAAPAVAPAPAAPAAPEGGEAAIALVKGFPLDGDRSTVGQWLQYSFAANPGDGNKEEWTAGAVDASTYLVQYQVHSGPNASSSQNINYVFEADVQRKTVRGNSENARQLLAGGELQAPKKVKTAPKASRRKRPARKARRKPSASVEANKPLSLLPLPTDAELIPPAEDDSSFQDPTVLQQPGQ